MIEDMEQGWYLVPKNKIIAKKKFFFISILLAWLGFRRTKVVDVYSMIVRSYATPKTIKNLVAHSFPIEHDNFPKPDQYPFYFRLMNGWSIEPASTIFLKDGPLFSESSDKIIVHSKIFAQSLLQQIWKLISVFGVLLGITVSLLKIFGLV